MSTDPSTLEPATSVSDVTTHTITHTHTHENTNRNTNTDTDTDTIIASENEDAPVLDVEYGNKSEFKYVGRNGEPADVFKESDREETQEGGQGNDPPLALSDGYYWRCQNKGSLVYRQQVRRVVDFGLSWVPDCDGPKLTPNEKKRYSGPLDQISTEYEVIKVS